MYLVEASIGSHYRRFFISYRKIIDCEAWEIPNHENTPTTWTIREKVPRKETGHRRYEYLTEYELKQEKENPEGTLIPGTRLRVKIDPQSFCLSKKTSLIDLPPSKIIYELTGKVDSFWTKELLEKKKDKKCAADMPRLPPIY